MMESAMEIVIGGFLLLFLICIWYSLYLEFQDWHVPEAREHRYSYLYQADGRMLAMIWRSTGRNKWNIHNYRCSRASVNRLIALANRYPRKFGAYL